MRGEGKEGGTLVSSALGRLRRCEACCHPRKHAPDPPTLLAPPTLTRRKQHDALDGVVVEHPRAQDAQHRGAVHLALGRHDVAPRALAAARLDGDDGRAQARVQRRRERLLRVVLQHGVVVGGRHVRREAHLQAGRESGKREGGKGGRGGKRVACEHRRGHAATFTGSCTHSARAAAPAAVLRAHLQAVRAEHDEQARRHLEGRGHGEHDGRDGDEELAQDDEHHPERRRVGAERKVRPAVLAAQQVAVRVGQLVVAHALGAQQLVLHDALAVAPQHPRHVCRVARRVAARGRSGARKQRWAGRRLVRLVRERAGVQQAPACRQALADVGPRPTLLTQ
jgi:hypothetical protein